MKFRAFNIFAIICLIFAGCIKNPFSTRDTEDPYGASGTWETPQSPEAALRNLLYAYNEMIMSNYELCFSDSFVFSSPEDSIDAVNSGREELFIFWNKPTEIAVTSNIFNNFTQTDSLSLFLSLSHPAAYSDLVEDTMAIMYRNYVVAIITSTAMSSDTVLAEGLATFHLRPEQLNWWTIYFWDDLPKNSGFYDWGDFKAEYRR